MKKYPTKFLLYALYIFMIIEYSIYGETLSSYLESAPK